MKPYGRLFWVALGMVTRGTPALGSDGIAASQAAVRFVPLVGIGLGLVAATVYWLAAQIWPTSVAVVLAMLSTTLLTLNGEESQPRLGGAYWVIVVLIKYNALMALSAAYLPLVLPAYFALGLIMVAAQAASRGLVISIMATDSPALLHVTNLGMVTVLLFGLAPAALLGIPGLIGLVAAILARLALGLPLLRPLRLDTSERLDIVQQISELSFYLGALASWKYV